MKKSTVYLVNSLKSLLQEFPVLVNSLEKKDPAFLPKLFQWITKAEEIMSSYNISEVSEMAGLRSKIIAAKFSDDRGMSTRKEQLKIAADALYALQKTVLQVLTPRELLVEEGRNLIIQLLQLVSQTQAIKYNPDLPFDNFVNDVWAFIKNTEQLKPGAFKLKTSLIMSDIHLLMAEEVDLAEF